MMTKRFLILMFLLICTFSAEAQRLPAVVIPKSYAIWLHPDLAAGGLEGKVTIAIEVLSPTDSILLNSVDLNVNSFELISGGRRWTGIAQIEKEKEMVNLKFNSTIPSGQATLSISYDGHLRDDLRGLYRIKTNGRIYAATQFEGTYARMMFPCFDEPEYKATYELDVTVNTGDTAISNAPVKSDTPGPGIQEHTIHFSQSPIMSTYLFALAIGDFQCLKGEADGIPIRVCAVPQKKELGEYALRSAEFFLSFYNKWYSIPYPFGKLDMVAIPDYEWGGMENSACIFYRESALLLDEKSASVSARRRVASVLAHEISHQWFGDLVTMQWWDDIWLNESFATWITHKALAAYDHSWDQNVERTIDATAVQSTDTLATTRAIRATAESSDEIKEMFDGITYQKGAAVLEMLENYTGADDFRKSVNAYLQKYQNRNATAENFWDTVTSVSGKPVSQVMPTFIDQAGIPLMNATQACNDGKASLHLSQTRFYSDVEKMNAQNQSEVWKIPFCIRAVGSKPDLSCRLLVDREQTFPLPDCNPVLVNAGAHGYYISQYAPDVLHELAAGQKQSPAELIQLIQDQWLLVTIGRIDIGQFLDIADRLKTSKNPVVLQLLIQRLETIDRKLANGKMKNAYQRWFLSWLDPVWKEIGSQPQPGDSDDQKELRSTTFRALGMAGNLQVIETSLELVHSDLQHLQTTDPSLLGAAFEVAANHGDAKLFDELVAHLGQDLPPNVRVRYVFSLASFSDPACVRRAIDYATSPKMAAQYLPGFFADLLMGTGRSIAWNFLKEHWQEMQNKVVSFGGAGAIAALGEACDPATEQDVQLFFENHPAPAAERTVKRSLESIRNCIQLRRLQESNFEKWLSLQLHEPQNASGAARLTLSKE